MDQKVSPVTPVSAPKSETAKREEEVLRYWKENRIFEKTLEKPAPRGEFVFYDGPPFATGLPHHGSLLSSVIKDVVPRYKTMRGYHVRRRWGWDTHGLPIESLVERELGLKTKKDILSIGIAAFNEKARSMVLQFVNDWEHYVDRVGRWVDFKDSYKTMDNSYIESVWWGLKQLHEKQLLYEGRKVLMYCPHCETPLAKAEIAMDNTYKDVTEEAVTVRFKIARPSRYGLPENTSLLAWTTTPWTLPGNVALAVGPDISYVLVPDADGMVILAKDRLEILKTAGKRPKMMIDMGREYKGSQLVGMEYEPLYTVPAMISHAGKKHSVLAADFVTTTEGTGIVHTAVMYGEDDFTLGQKENLPMVQLLNPDGTYGAEAPESLRGKYIKDAERDIKRDLEARGLLFSKENNTHSYPHCYRCGTSLIYNAVSSWFINIQKVKDTMLSENEKVTWVPEHLKQGRFKHIVENAPDWTISRNRFWASPLPIWKEKGGERVMVIGSLDELKQHAKKSGNRYFVMRHGEAENNAKGVVTRDPQSLFGLTEEGKEHARKGAEKLRGLTNVRIYASPVRRAKETAEIAADVIGVDRSQIVFDDRLKEFDFGTYEGKTIQDFMAYRKEHMSRLDSAIPGGESYLSAKIRFGEFLKEIDTKHSGETVVVVSHGIGCESLHAIATGADEKESWRIINEIVFDYAFVGEIPYAPLPLNARCELDLHRPYADSIILLDEQGREYERIPEVVDCWVESGAMPFAEYHYPFENKQEFEKRAPADFIAEYIAQTRTWFYYMHALGVLLFGRLAFRSVVSTGNILGNDGAKMSKSKGNYTDPLRVIDQFGADAYRFYMMGSVVMQAEDFIFRDEDVRDTHNRVVGMLWNTFKFFELHKDAYDGNTHAASSPHILDRWILARMGETVRAATGAYDAFDMPRACRTIKAFIDDYSTWYVRRSRERAKGEGRDMQFTLATQREVLLTLAKLLAPVTPYLAESIYRGALGKLESVHLESWPEVHRGLFNRWFKKDESLLKAMAATRTLVSRSLEARDKAGIKVRQPLALLEIRRGAWDLNDALLDVVKEEVNVKEVRVSDIAEELKLDTTITPELKEEGLARDVMRAIQVARKEAALSPDDIAEVIIDAPQEVRAVIEKHAEVAAGTRATITFGAVTTPKQKVGGYEVALSARKQAR